MFLSRKIDIKFTQKFIYIQFLVEKVDLITDHIQQIRNQSENDDIPEKPNCNLGFPFSPINIV